MSTCLSHIGGSIPTSLMSGSDGPNSLDFWQLYRLWVLEDEARIEEERVNREFHRLTDGLFGDDKPLKPKKRN